MFLNCWLAKHALENMIVSGGVPPPLYPAPQDPSGAACHTPGLAASWPLPSVPQEAR